ncbi:MAG: hypothetical protein AAFZ09_10460 [Pseudomonadota bacterium]
MIALQAPSHHPLLAMGLLAATLAATAIAEEFQLGAGREDSFRAQIFDDQDNWREVEGEENTWRIEPEVDPNRSQTDRMRLLEDDRNFISRRLYSTRRGQAGSPY